MFVYVYKHTHIPKNAINSGEVPAAGARDREAIKPRERGAVIIGLCYGFDCIFT